MKSSKDFFNSKKKHTWWLSAASITLLSTSAQIPLVQSQILAERGISGIWILACVFLGSGLIIYFFSQFWQVSELKNDNEIVSLRYDVLGAGVLRSFRAIYVGLIVFPILTAMMLVSFIKVAHVYSGWESQVIIWITIIFGVASVLFTNFTLKIIRDGILIWLFLPALLIVVGYSFYLILSDPSLNVQSVIYEWKLQPWSALFGMHSTVLVADVLIFVGILWWSNGVLDGSGGDAQRFLNTKSPKQAQKAALISRILLVFCAGAFLLVNIAAMGVNSPDPELKVLFFMFRELPQSLSFVFMLVLSMAFFTTVDGFLNVAASYLYSMRKSSESTPINTREAQVISLILLLISGFFVYAYQSVTDLLLLMIAMGAGVGPTFALRWFWMRLNAWSQLSAMLSSLVLVILYDILAKTSPGFQAIISKLSMVLQMSQFGFKIVVLTLLVTIIWLVVTFLTPPTSPQKIAEFRSRIFGESSKNELLPGNRVWLWMKIVLSGVGLGLLYFWGYGLVVLVG